MLRLMTTILLMASMATAHADTVTFSLGSKHFNETRNHNEFNYGIGYEIPTGNNVHWEGMIYRNSRVETSFSVGIKRNKDMFIVSDSLKFGYSLGASVYLKSDVHDTEVLPIISGYGKYTVYKGFDVRLSGAKNLLALQLGYKL